GPRMSEDYDIAVIGGGLVGAALAWGVAGEGRRIAVLDEGDVALRAARGNFALVWVQGKGLGLPEYAAWTARSAEAWPDFAAALGAETGIDLGYRRPGGFTWRCRRPSSSGARRCCSGSTIRRRPTRCAFSAAPKRSACFPRSAPTSPAPASVRSTAM